MTQAILAGPFEFQVPGSGRKEKSLPDQEAMIATLRELQQDYNQNFAPGDIVTIRRGVNLKRAGRPHIVMEVLDSEGPRFDGDFSMPDFGSRPEVRAMTFINGDYICHWFERWQLVPYDGQTEED